jgi:rhamnosyl/mannosyltransferase
MRTQRRVVHVYKTYPPVRGGIEGHIALLARLSAAHGVTASVLCTRPVGAAAASCDGPIAVQRCMAPLTLASTPLPPTLPWALHQHPADIVHLHLPWPPGEVAWLLGGRRRPWR